MSFMEPLGRAGEPAGWQLGAEMSQDGLGHVCIISGLTGALWGLCVSSGLWEGSFLKQNEGSVVRRRVRAAQEANQCPQVSPCVVQHGHLFSVSTAIPDRSPHCRPGGHSLPLHPAVHLLLPGALGYEVCHFLGDCVTHGLANL